MLDKVMSLSPHFDVLVVDDGSPDGTAALVSKCASIFPGRIHLLEREGKQGLGTAYIAGFNWALKHEHYAFIYEMDADFSHNPDDLIRLRQACLDGADLSIGSRYVKGGKVENWPFIRRFISRGGSTYARFFLWMGVKDTTSGFKCYRRKVLQTLDLNSIKYIGYAFQIEMKYMTKQAGFKLSEVPITFKDRERGNSKMSMAIFQEGMMGVIRIRLRSLFN